MFEHEPALVSSMLLLFVLSTLILVWFMRNNSARLGLLGVLLSLIAGGLGLSLAFGAGDQASVLTLSVAYMLLIGSHNSAWLGVAAFWQKKTRRLVMLTILLALATYILELKYILNGGDKVGRIAISAGYFSLSSFGIVMILARAKSISHKLYHTSVQQSQLGTYIVLILFFFHGLFNLLRFAQWQPFGLPAFEFVNILGADSDFTLVESIIFAPILVLGTVIMVAERLQTELKIEQMLDPVTKTLNRRAFVAVAKAVLARARRNAEAVSLILIEVTNFKDMRETVGRKNADEIMMQVADSIFGGRREQDIYCRFSNDEFMLLLPGTPEEGAEQVEERIVAAVKVLEHTEQGLMVSSGLKLAHHTARGEDLDTDGMIDTVTKKAMVLSAGTEPKSAVA